MEPVAAISILTAIYCSATFAGAITAILINTPGTSASATTCLDGYPMAIRGEAGRALGIAVVSSTIGGVFSVLALRGHLDRMYAESGRGGRSTPMHVRKMYKMYVNESAVVGRIERLPDGVRQLVQTDFNVGMVVGDHVGVIYTGKGLELCIFEQT